MRGSTWERLAAATGLATVALLIVAFALAGDEPSLGASGQAIAADWADKGNRFYVSLGLCGLATVTLAWFAGAVSFALREAGEARLAIVTAIGAAAGIGLLLVALAAEAALTHSVATAGDAGAAKALFSLAWSVFVLVSFPFGAMVVAGSIAAMRSALMPAWFGYGGVAAGIVVLLGGIPWAQDGFFRPDGPLAWISTLAFMLWIATASGMLVRLHQGAEAPRAAMMPT